MLFNYPPTEISLAKINTNTQKQFRGFTTKDLLSLSLNISGIIYVNWSWKQSDFSPPVINGNIHLAFDCGLVKFRLVRPCREEKLGNERIESRVFETNVRVTGDKSRRRQSTCFHVHLDDVCSILPCIPRIGMRSVSEMLGVKHKTVNYCFGQ